MRVPLLPPCSGPGGSICSVTGRVVVVVEVDVVVDVEVDVEVEVEVEVDVEVEVEVDVEDSGAPAPSTEPLEHPPATRAARRSEAAKPRRRARGQNTECPVSRTRGVRTWSG